MKPLTLLTTSVMVAVEVSCMVWVTVLLNTSVMVAKKTYSDEGLHTGTSKNPPVATEVTVWVSFIVLVSSMVCVAVAVTVMVSSMVETLVIVCGSN